MCPPAAQGLIQAAATIQIVQIAITATGVMLTEMVVRKETMVAQAQVAVIPTQTGTRTAMTAATTAMTMMSIEITRITTVQEVVALRQAESSRTNVVMAAIPQQRPAMRRLPALPAGNAIQMT